MKDTTCFTPCADYRRASIAIATAATCQPESAELSLPAGQ